MSGSNLVEHVNANSFHSNIHILGLMCTVELIPVPAPELLAQSDSASPSSLPESVYSPPPQSPEGTYGFGSPASMTRYSTPGSPGMFVDPEGGSHKATTALAGTTFVQVDSIPWNGRTCLLFTFAVSTIHTRGCSVAADFSSHL